MRRKIHDKNWINFLQAWMGMVMLVFCASMIFYNASAEETVAGEEETVEEKIEYDVVKEKEPLYMLPGEIRMANNSIPYDATFESNNLKVAGVNGYGQIFAYKKGTAKITMTSGTTKTIYKIVVRDTVDLIVFAGQSNMCGSGGNKTQAPMPNPGTAYEFDITTGTKRTILMKEPFGEGMNRGFSILGSEQYSTKGTLVSSFAIQYYKQTKVPVVGVSASWGGSSTNTWLTKGLVGETQKRLNAAKKQLKKNKVKVRHIYMVWYQGESDAEKGLTIAEYNKAMKKIYKKMHSAGVEKVFMIRIGYRRTDRDTYYTIMDAQSKLCAESKNFIMASKKASVMCGEGRFYDDIHINQTGLNKIGADAGKTAGKYVWKLED